MAARVVQTSPDVALTVRLPKRGEAPAPVVAVPVVAVQEAAPGAPVWLGWRGQSGLPAARLEYATARVEVVGDLRVSVPPLFWPQVWQAAVPRADGGVRQVTWRGEIRVRFVLGDSRNMDAEPVTVAEETVAFQMNAPAIPATFEQFAESIKKIMEGHSPGVVMTAAAGGTPASPPQSQPPVGPQFWAVAGDISGSLLPGVVLQEKNNPPHGLVTLPQVSVDAVSGVLTVALAGCGLPLPPGAWLTAGELNQGGWDATMRLNDNALVPALTGEMFFTAEAGGRALGQVSLLAPVVFFSPYSEQIIERWKNLR